MNLFAISLVLLSLALWAQVGGKNDLCQNIEIKSRQLGKMIVENIHYRSVEAEVNYLEKMVNQCQLNPASYGWGRGVFKYWRNEGRKSEFERLEYESKFRDISDSIPDFLKNDRRINLLVKSGMKIKLKNKSSCSSVDLRNGLPPIRDQGPIGWCYAFVAADLLSYKLNDNISAADIALNYNDNWLSSIDKFFGKREEDFSGGIMLKAIQKLQKKGGACLEKDVRSDDNGQNNLLYNIQKISEYINGERKSCQEELKAIFPFQDYSSFKKLASETSGVSLFSELRERNCKKRIGISDIKIHKKYDHLPSSGLYFPADYRSSKETGHFKDIDEQLEKRNVIGISYYGSVLYKEQHLLRGNHSSVVVGRRYNSKSGECEYLVRNSFGRGCLIYGYDCEEGNIWLPKSRLNRGLNGVTYLE